VLIALAACERRGDFSGGVARAMWTRRARSRSRVSPALAGPCAYLFTLASISASQRIREAPVPIIVTASSIGTTSGVSTF
jgi:hypothetical protein